jgi:hypothetical protein
MSAVIRRVVRDGATFVRLSASQAVMGSWPQAQNADPSGLRHA